MSKRTHFWLKVIERLLFILLNVNVEFERKLDLNARISYKACNDSSLSKIFFFNFYNIFFTVYTIMNVHFERDDKDKSGKNKCMNPSVCLRVILGLA